KYHGHGGEWRVEHQRLKWKVLEDFAEACVESGIPRTRDFNRGDNEGVDYFEVNQRSGWRWNASKAFLRESEKRSNLTLWHSTHVLGLETDTSGQEPRCTGVRVERGGDGEQIARATREVILSAGAIGSPQLLQLSGIGPADLLKAHDIPVVLDLPGVGENLQDHLQIRSVYKIQGAT
ncbi:GMC family oxidoreductase, partial [Streptomyces chitinivorans]